MPAAPRPHNEVDRIAALQSYEILDTACEDAFDNIAHLAAELTSSPISLVSLIDSDRQWFKARVGLEETETPREHAFCAHAILNPDQPLVVNDARQDERFRDNPLVLGAPDIRFYAGMPLVNQEGAALGTLCVIDREPRQLGDNELRVLRRLAETVVTTLELRRAMIKIRELSLVDPLTGIANRPALMDALERIIAQQIRHGGVFGLLYIDLDGFKRVNDEFGHAAGDEVLRVVASSLTATLRREDIVARIGGDEFAAILVADEGQTTSAAERVRSAIELSMRDRGWQVTASIGAVSFPCPPGNADEALARADRLMYAAKRLGKNAVQYAALSAVDGGAA